MLSGDEVCSDEITSGPGAEDDDGEPCDEFEPSGDAAGMCVCGFPRRAHEPGAR